MTNRLRTLLLSTLLPATFFMAIAQSPVVPPSLQSALTNLADQPATHTSFSFDRSELQVAQNLLQPAPLFVNRRHQGLRARATPCFSPP